MQNEERKKEKAPTDVIGSAAKIIRNILSAAGEALGSSLSDLSPKESVIFILKCVGTGLFSAAISAADLALSSYPLGLSFLSSATCYLPFIYIGCVTGAILSGTHTAAYAVTYTSIFILRAVISRFLAFPDLDDEPRRPVARHSPHSHVPKLSIPKSYSPSYQLFKEKVYLRMTVACGAGFALGIWRIVAGGFLYYDLFGAIFLIVLCPFLVFFYCGLFEKKDSSTPYFEAGLAVAMFSIVTAIDGITLFTLDLGIIFSFTVTLIISKVGGGLRAGAIGLLCGIAIDPISAPMLGLAGLISSLLWKYSYMLSIIASAAASVLFGVYAEGITAVFRLLPEITVSSVALVPILKSGILSKVDPFPLKSVGASPPPMPKELATGTEHARFEALSDTISSLSDTFRSISVTSAKPNPDELKQICSGVCEKYCQKCSMKNLCWEKDRASTADMISRIADQLYAKGRATGAALPEYMLRRCFRINNIIEDSNRGAARLLSQVIKANNAKNFALDYEAVSALIDSAISDNENDRMYDPELSDKLREALIRSEFSAEAIGVYGRRRHYVTASGICLPRTKIKTPTLHKIAENVLGEPLSAPEYSIDGNNVSFTMKTQPCIRTEYASAKRTKAGSETSGDSYSVFDTKEDYSYSIISDGMGSGRRAAAASKLSLMILSKMLTAGNNRSAAVGMLAAFLRGERDECSSTVDICEIDLLRKKAVFHKCGAAPSFVRRGGKLFKLESKTFPVGILDSCDAEEISFSLEEEDVIIMFSDGVTQSFDEGVWLLPLLDEDWDDDLDRMAEKIAAVSDEVKKGGDDITVILVRIKGAEPEGSDPL